MPRGECQNCKCAIPDNRWCCDDCFPYFDGEKFLDPEDCEIMYVTDLADLGFSTKKENKDV